jgi:hypothetical protein
MAQKKAESDVQADNAQVRTRPEEEFVGRAAEEDVGYAEETGAERRAEGSRRREADGRVDEQSSDSFPASDPPSNY